VPRDVFFDFLVVTRTIGTRSRARPEGVPGDGPIFGFVAILSTSPFGLEVRLVVG
jgi:hypothetical protein